MLTTSQHIKNSATTFSEKEEEAFLRIYDEHWQKVFLVAYKRLGKKEIAEELTQELFLTLWEKRHTLRLENIENYLFIAIKNAVIDHIHSGLIANRYINFYKMYGTISSINTQNVVEFDDLSEAIERGLQRLPTKTQQVFKLSRLQSWSMEKIAHHLQLSEKTVGYHLTKSLKFMRTYLREYLLTFVFLILR